MVVFVSRMSTGNLSSAVFYFTLESEAYEDPPEFTLTCQSRTGPVTGVEWRRNGVRVEEDSNHMTSQIIVATSAITIYNESTKVQNPRRNSYAGLTCTYITLASYILRMRVRVPRCP